MRLREDGGETVLSYTAKAQVGGKLAQVGSRLIDGTVRKLSGQFFAKLSEHLAASRGCARGGCARARGPRHDVRRLEPESVDRRIDRPRRAFAVGIRGDGWPPVTASP